MRRSEDFDAMPTGTVVTTPYGNRWRKLTNGMWDCLSDPGWGPHTSRDLPGFARPLTSPTQEESND